MPVIAVISGGMGGGRLVEGGKRVPDADNPPLGRVVEFDHAELDDLVLAMIEASRLCVEQDASPGLLRRWPGQRYARDKAGIE